MSFFQLKKFLDYKLNAVGKHSLHSPFVYRLNKEVLQQKTNEEAFNKIESLRSGLLLDNRVITINDYGAGSSVDASPKRSIRDMAKSGLSDAKFSKTLFHLSKFIQARTIVELGTSFGINALYLSESSLEGTVYSFEGCSETQEVAKQVIESAKVKNIHLIDGNIDKTLPDFVSSKQKIDLVYFDANHQYQPTMDYFNLLQPFSHQHSVFVIDDIYWSKEMTRAWKKLKQHPAVTLSIDIFDAGLLFFNNEFSKENHIIDY